MNVHFAKNRPLRLAFLPAALLTLGHVFAGLALLTFGMRAGGYPLHLIGLMIYLAASSLSLVILWSQFFRPQPTLPAFAQLVVVSLPALVSLIFAATFWLTPNLGGAPYAPYDPADSDGVMLFMLLFAITFAAMAGLYGSFKYGLSACIVQVLIYFGTYALPHWFRYPEASLLGVRPAILGEIMGLYALAFGLLFVRTKLKWSLPQDVRLAALVTNLVGALVLFHLLNWLPGNGAYLGYVSATTFVPQSAWDWSRPAAQGLAILSGSAALLLGVGSLIHKPKRTAT